MRVQNLMNSLWDIRIFLGLVPKESLCIYNNNELKVTQPEVGYLVLARNGCDEFEFVAEYIDMTLQNMFKSKHRSRDLTPS